MRSVCDVTCLAKNLNRVCFEGFTDAFSVFSLLVKLALKTHQQLLRDLPYFLILSHIIIVV